MNENDLQRWAEQRLADNPDFGVADSDIHEVLDQIEQMLDMDRKGAVDFLCRVWHFNRAERRAAQRKWCRA